jgi:cysteine desulfurase
MNEQRPVYLDHNASTPVLPEVLEAMLPYLSDRYGNPSSNHHFGRTMHDAVGRAREQVARLIDCKPSELYLTSGGTEANNLAIRGTAAANETRRTIVTSTIEHPATSQPCFFLEEAEYSIRRTGVDDKGTVRLHELVNAVGTDTVLVTVMHANSETGTLQPIREISRIAHASGALMHTDAAQSVGKVSVSVQHEEVDLLSIAGHKIYASQGIGALFIRTGTPIKPLLLGAGHESGMRPGTENVAAIAGLGQACAIAYETIAEESRRVGALRDHLWGRLRQQIPELALNGHPEHRLPNTLNARFPGVSGNALLAACPAVAASTGSACHEDKDSASSVILAMGIPQDEAAGSVRLTLGRGSNLDQVNRAADALVDAWKSLSVNPDLSR